MIGLFWVSKPTPYGTTDQDEEIARFQRFVPVAPEYFAKKALYEPPAVMVPLHRSCRPKPSYAPVAGSRHESTPHVILANEETLATGTAAKVDLSKELVHDQGPTLSAKMSVAPAELSVTPKLALPEKYPTVVE